MNTSRLAMITVGMASLAAGMLPVEPIGAINPDLYRRPRRKGPSKNAKGHAERAEIKRRRQQARGDRRRR